MWCSRTRPEVLQATSSCFGCSMVLLLLLGFASLPLKCFSHISVRPTLCTEGPQDFRSHGDRSCLQQQLPGGWLRTEGLRGFRLVVYLFCWLNLLF